MITRTGTRKGLTSLQCNMNGCGHTKGHEDENETETETKDEFSISVSGRSTH